MTGQTKQDLGRNARLREHGNPQELRDPNGLQAVELCLNVRIAIQCNGS